MKKYPNGFLPVLLGAACTLAVAGVLGAQKPTDVEPKSRDAKPPTRSDSILVLTRRAEKEPDAKLSFLLESLSSRHAGKMAREKLADRTRAAGQDWRLDVFGDGSGAEFLDQAAADRAHKQGVESAKAMSAQALESAGRTYIERNLAKVIELQQGERLVPFTTSFRTEGGVGRDGRNSHSAVVANRIIFSREINGIPVVGAGSKVTVTFLNDGTVESFRYDWPTYSSTGREQQLAPSREILQRVQRVAGVRAKSDLTGPIAAPANIEAIKEPVRLGDRVQLQDLKCGYYDPGYSNRDAEAPVQAGCYYHVIHTQGSGEYTTTAAYSGAVPSAVKPEADSRWPQAAMLSGQVVESAPPPTSAGPSSKTEPVAPRPKQPEPPAKSD